MFLRFKNAQHAFFRIGILNCRVCKHNAILSLCLQMVPAVFLLAEIDLRELFLKKAARFCKGTTLLAMTLRVLIHDAVYQVKS